jgi:hypothetical protein
VCDRSRRSVFPPHTSVTMSLKFDEACQQTVELVRSDKSELDWVAFKYEGKAKLLVGGKGSGG